MEGVVGGTKQNIVTLQTVNNWESVAIQNKTKATLYDELREQLPMEMGELLKEARAESMSWHFEQTRKYTIPFDVAYERIQQLEEKDKEEKNMKEVASEEAT
jgi:hypothetical protein